MALNGPCFASTAIAASPWSVSPGWGLLACGLTLSCSPAIGGPCVCLDFTGRHQIQLSAAAKPPAARSARSLAQALRNEPALRTRPLATLIPPPPACSMRTQRGAACGALPAQTRPESTAGGVAFASPPDQRPPRVNTIGPSLGGNVTPACHALLVSLPASPSTQLSLQPP